MTRPAPPVTSALLATFAAALLLGLEAGRAFDALDAAIAVVVVLAGLADANDSVRRIVGRPDLAFTCTAAAAPATAAAGRGAFAVVVVVVIGVSSAAVPSLGALGSCVRRRVGVGRRRRCWAVNSPWPPCPPRRPRPPRRRRRGAPDDRARRLAGVGAMRPDSRRAFAARTRSRRLRGRACRVRRSLAGTAFSALGGWNRTVGIAAGRGRRRARSAPGRHLVAAAVLAALRGARFAAFLARGGLLCSAGWIVVSGLRVRPRSSWPAGGRLGLGAAAASGPTAVGGSGATALAVLVLLAAARGAAVFLALVRLRAGAAPPADGCPGWRSWRSYRMDWWARSRACGKVFPSGSRAPLRTSKITVTSRDHWLEPHRTGASRVVGRCVLAIGSGWARARKQRKSVDERSSKRAGPTASRGFPQPDRLRPRHPCRAPAGRRACRNSSRCPCASRNTRGGSGGARSLTWRSPARTSSGRTAGVRCRTTISSIAQPVASRSPTTPRWTTGRRASRVRRPSLSTLSTGIDSA